MGVKKGTNNPNYPKTRASRQYITPYSISLNQRNRFTIPESQDFVNALYAECEEYCSSHALSQGNTYRLALGTFVLNLHSDFDVSIIDGKYLVDFHNLYKEKTGYIPFVKSLIKNFMILNKKHNWNQVIKEISVDILPHIDSIQNIWILVIPLLDGTKNHHYFRIFKNSTLNYYSDAYTLIEFDTSSRFIQDLLLDFITEVKTQIRVYNMLFVKHFGSSLENNVPNDIYGFNIDTLKKQSLYFSKLHVDSDLMCRKFYRFLLEKKQGESKSITIKDGVNILYLMSSKFSQRINEGYKLVLLNPNENYPQHDKWATLPNGLDEQTSSDKPNQIRYMDFERITNPTIRKFLKQWFWTESKSGFENRYRNIIYIIEFFEYREKLRKDSIKNFVDVYSFTAHTSILAEEIILYTAEWKYKLTKQSYLSRISPLKIFLTYLYDNDLFNIEVAVFEYLNTKNQGQTPKQEILPIPKEDFKKLIDTLESKAKSNNLHMLYYIAFCLNTLTPLRISSVLDLDYDCVHEKSKGIYALKVKVKTSEGDKKEVQISRQVKRLIEIAISITTETRLKAPRGVKHYLFLVNNNKDIYKSIPHRSYNKHLQACCNAAKIPLYSANNLRKTYYTNLVENAIKNNVSLISLKELTGHANVDTTDNYYVKENIRNYLEATNGVEIGTMRITGSVVNEYPEATKENLVNNECGYCRNSECNVIGTANCLMCKGFITTPTHIHQFEEAINVLNTQIRDNPNIHDKEHLYAVKRLYVTYLEQLYIRKEDTENATITT